MSRADRIVIAAALMLSAIPAWAGEADVLTASAQRQGDGWRVTATVAHADTGWEHYADAFEVLLPDGTVLTQRILVHPHVNEQPFTRSTIEAVIVPAGITTLLVRARDNVDGHGGRTYELRLGD